MAATGQNVWYELMTTDVEGAKSFYSETIGWKPQIWEDGDPNMPYTMWMVGEQAVGAIMALPDEARQGGAPPHWLAYTVVDDVDATSAKATKLGGKTLKPAWNVPKVGRLAILNDPQGATFAIFKPEQDTPTSAPSKAGEFSWAELHTTDYQAAWTFYSELFGWQERGTMDMGPQGTYFMFNDPDEVTKGGMDNMAQQMNAPAHWLYYVTVDDMDGAVERIKRHGGTILNGPMSIPGDDQIAQCQDPQGVAFAVYAAGKNSNG